MEFFVLTGNSNEEWEQPTSITHETDPILEGEPNIGKKIFPYSNKILFCVDNEWINRYWE